MVQSPQESGTYLRSRYRPFVILLVCLAGLAVNAIIYLPFLRISPNNDFLGLYPGGKLAGTAHLYDSHAVMSVQFASAHIINPQRLFVRLPFYAALLWPLARLPYLPALHLYRALLIVTIALFVCLWPSKQRSAALVACSWSLPLAASLVIGQDVALLLAVIAGTLWLMNRDRHFLAGLLFSLCAIKPHLFLLFPAVILAQKLWTLLAGFLAGGVLLLCVSFLAAGPHWLSAFVRVATLPGTNPQLHLMPNLHALWHGNSWPEASCACCLALLVWYIARRTALEWSFAAALAAGILASHHAYVADCAILIPALLIALARATHRWQQWFALFMLSPAAYVGIYLNGAPALIVRLLLVLLCLSFAIRPETSRKRYSPTLDQAIAPNDSCSRPPSSALLHAD